MRVIRTGMLGLAAVAAAVGLAACGGGGGQAGGPTTTGAAPTTGPRTTVTAASTTAPASSTIPTLPPVASTTTAPTTTLPPTTLPVTTTSTTATSTTTTSTTTVPETTTTVAPTTSTTAGVPPCRSGQLTAALGKGGGAAGSVYFQLEFHNVGSSSCSLYGYPGVSYVAGSEGTQVGSPATRNAGISGAAGPTVVVLTPGGSAKATLQEVDVQNYPVSACQPTPVRGLRVYPPDQAAALFVPQTATGCQVASAHQLSVGFVTP